MEKTAESLKVLPQNDFGEWCEGWQAVGSCGNYCEGEGHVDAIIMLTNPLRRIKSHLPFANIIRRFNVYGSGHRKYILIYIQQDATLHSLFISGNWSTFFGWYFHPKNGAHTTVSTASGICHTVTAICRYRGRVGTGLSVLLMAYATHSTLKPVPTLPR
jgi:hypothetical protein